VQTSDSASASSARAAQASRESAQAAKDRRAAAREDDGPGGVAVFSELVAQAGAQLDAQPAGAAGDAPNADEPGKTEESAVPAGSLPAALLTLPAALHSLQKGSSGPGEAPGLRGGPAAAATQGGDAGPGLDAATTTGDAPAGATQGTDAGTGPGIAAQITAAADGVSDTAGATALARAAAQAATGKSAQVPQDPLGGAAASGGPAGIAQAALAQALREIRSGASERPAAAARPASITGDGVGGERGSRLRRGGPDAAAAAAAGRDATTMVDGMGAAGSLTARAVADVASLAAAGSGTQSDRSPAGTGAGGDASVFALTMNQASAGISLAATRAEMLAETTQAMIDVPVDHADFSEAFARQSASLVVQGSSQAQIQLNPRDLGPIRISISLDANAASLDIAADHADTRAAIEASMPALRQMLADQGIRLADYRLDSQAAGDRQQHAGGDPGRHESGRHPQSGEAAQAGLAQLGGGNPGSADAAALASGFGRRDGATAGERGGSGASPAAAGAAGQALRDGLTGVLPAGATRGGNNSRIDLYA